MRLKASSVKEYLQELPIERRQALEAVLAVIRKNVDADVEEGMQYGMISFHVPHRVYPPGYHCDPSQPLPYVAIASQKNHMAIYLFCIYTSPGGEAGDLFKWFVMSWKAAGKKLDMGKSCLRFKRIEDLELGLIGELLRRLPTKAHIANYESNLQKSASRKSTSTRKSIAISKSPKESNAQLANSKKMNAGSRKVAKKPKAKPTRKNRPLGKK